MTQAPPTPDAGMNPALASYLSALGGQSGTTSAPQGTDLLSILQRTLFGTTTTTQSGDVTNPRRGLTSQPLVGLMPKWIYSQPVLRDAVQAGTFDPYLVSDKPDTWRVYVGPGAVTEHKASPNNKFATEMTPGSNAYSEQGHDKSQMVSTVKNQPFLWSEDQIAEGIKKFQDAGATGVNDFQSLVSAWGGLVEAAGARYSLSSGKLKTTPWDMLALYKDSATKAGTLGGGSGGSPTRVTQTSRSVSEITHGDGWSALQNTLSKMLGRDPTDEETRDFVGRMNHLAAKNPTISTSTTSGIGSAHQSTTSHTQGGFDSNDILENAYADAQANPDYAEFQSASTYFNSALSALGAIGG